MPLINNIPNDEAPEQRLAREARARLGEITQSMLLTYGNLMNYQHNNGAGVGPKQYEKALGSDAKDYRYILGAMRRMLLRLNPGLKDQLNEMVPKKPKKTAK